MQLAYLHCVIRFDSRLTQVASYHASGVDLGFSKGGGTEKTCAIILSDYRSICAIKPLFVGGLAS